MEFKSFPWPSNMPFKRLVRVNYLVVHHSESGDVSATTIDQWHKNKGWLGIGYHYVIRKDGSLEQGRPEWAVGAHCLNHNHESLGVCLTGNFMREMPTSAQMNTLVVLLSELQGKYPGAKVMPHRALSSTSCPGDKFPWQELIERLQKGNVLMGVQIAPWKMQIIEEAKQAGIITQDHNPDDPVSVWFVLAIALNLLKVVRGNGR